MLFHKSTDCWSLYCVSMPRCWQQGYRASLWGEAGAVPCWRKRRMSRCQRRYSSQPMLLGQKKPLCIDCMYWPYILTVFLAQLRRKGCKGARSEEVETGKVGRKGVILMSVFLSLTTLITTCFSWQYIKSFFLQVKSLLPMMVISKQSPSLDPELSHSWSSCFLPLYFSC